MARCLAAVWLAWLPAATLAAQGERSTESFDVAVGLLRRELWDDAAKQFRAFLRRHPQHERAPEAWYRLGVCCQELGKPDEAVAAFESALEAGDADKLRAECRYRLAKTLQSQDRKAEAQRQLTALIDEIGADHYLRVPALYADAECQRDLAGKERGKKVEAARAFLAAAATEQSRGDEAAKAGTFGLPALYQAGFLLLEAERHAEAADAFAAAASSYPRHEAAAECQWLEGEAALRGNDLERAAKAYRRAVERGGKHEAEARFGLATCQARSGASAEAVAGYREVYGGFPSSPLAAKARLEAGRLLHRQKDHAAAERELNALLQSDNLPAELRCAALELCGLACLDGNRAAQAIVHLEACLAAVPAAEARPRVAFSLAEARVEQGDLEAALSDYDAAAQSEDVALAGDALYGGCVAAHRLGLHDESLARAQQLLERCPDHRLAAQARYAVGENLFAQQKWAAADAAYAEVRPRAEADADLGRKAAFKRAWCAYLGNDRERAAERFAAIAGDQTAPQAEEALSMQALALHQLGRDDEALAAADRYRARYPRGQHLARTERVAAQVLTKRDDLAGAAQRLKMAAAAEGAPARAAEDRLQLADLAFRQGDFAAARGHYRELTEAADRTGALAQQGLAWCAFETGDDDECQARIELGLRHPQGAELRPGLLELLVSLHHRGERWAEAIAAAETFLSEHPRHARQAEVRFALGLAQARSGDLAAARRTLESLGDGQGLARPDRALYELAWVCRRAKDEPASLAAFRRLLAVSKDDDLAGEACLYLGEAALAQKRIDEGRQLLARAKGRCQGQALYRLGFSFFDAGEPGRARPHFEAVLALGDSALSDEALFLVGECAFLSGEHAPAGERFDALLQRAPEHARAQAARLRLGELRVLLAQPAAAVAALEEFLRRAGAEPGDDAGRAEAARAWGWLGRARQARSEAAAAEEAFARVTQLSEGPLAAEAQYRIGETRQARQDLEGAVEAWLKLTILYAHEEWVQRGLLATGLAYEKLGQPAKAVKLAKELVSRFPSSEASKEARSLLKRIGEG